MAMKQVIEAMELLDAPITSREVAALLRERSVLVEDVPVEGDVGKTTFLLMTIPGSEGKLAGGEAPTLGIIGMLGGLGASPTKIGLVSDADGAICALAACLKISTMNARGVHLKGDVLLATHICSDAAIIPHDPVPFMSSPIDMSVMNKIQVDPRMDAILSVDTTKGNRILNRRGIAITPTVKDGWILPVSEGLLDILEAVTGDLPAVLPLNVFDITPYGNGLPHINSIMQPSVATASPVVGVAVTARAAVPGCATGANQAFDLELAVRFCIEVAKAMGDNDCLFYDPKVFDRAGELYGSMKKVRGITGD